jgi:uncharacterized membrane protein
MSRLYLFYLTLVSCVAFSPCYVFRLTSYFFLCLLSVSLSFLLLKVGLQLNMIQNQVLYSETLLFMIEASNHAGVYFSGLFGMNFDDVNVIFTSEFRHSFLIITLFSLLIMFLFYLSLYNIFSSIFRLSFRNFFLIKVKASIDYEYGELLS